MSSPEKIPAWQHVKALFVLPITVTVVIPGVLLLATARAHAVSCPAWLAGMSCIVTGILLVYKSTRLFITVGHGTIAPWNPPQQMVVTGIYLHMRNPMITGVLFILLGEALFFLSMLLFFWALLFWGGNHIYFVKKEEPDLMQRFGRKYLVYTQHVPRWIPRLHPWNPASNMICTIL
jgi:protein-S-isoprenylcysteine O-methyltransferase Ste14